MNIHNQIMNIPISVDRSNWVPLEKNGYAHGHRDARLAAAELSLKAEARIEELEEALKELYIASGPVANCAYNVGQQHEDWENIRHYINQLDKARSVAINVIQEKSDD